ncbi:MAG: methyltransferase domain-containing protein [Bacteroidia bacterium]
MYLPLFVKRWLSYFKEVPVEYVRSEWHPVLVVKLSQGKFILDGERVNYAFEGLDAFFRLAFQKTGIPHENTKTALILGFGVGNVATILKEKDPSISITGVDADPVMKDLAEKYFGLKKLGGTEVITDDVVHYIRSTNLTFDLIVVDVFLEEKIPEPLQQRGVLRKLEKLLNAGGVLFFNTLGDTPELRDESGKIFETAYLVWKGSEQVQVINNQPIIYKKSGR